MKEMKDIPIYDCIKARWNDSDLQLLCFSLHLCMIDWCDDYNNEDFFRMNMDKLWSWFHQKLLKNNRRLFLFQIMHSVVQLVGYSIFSFRTLTFDELKIVVKECQLPMLLVMTHNQSEIQKHVI